MEDLKLTDYGTIVLGNNEVKVDTFLELLKKGKVKKMNEDFNNLRFSLCGNNEW